MAALTICQAFADEDPNARARRLVADLEKQNATVAKEPIERARAILERAAAERQGQNEGRARLLDDFALEWSQTGVDLVAAHALEKEASDLERKLTELETQVKRARVLLEETEARRGRAQTELLRLEPDADLPPIPTASASAATSAVLPSSTALPAPGSPTPAPAPSGTGAGK